MKIESQVDMQEHASPLGGYFVGCPIGPSLDPEELFIRAGAKPNVGRSLAAGLIRDRCICGYILTGPTTVTALRRTSSGEWIAYSVSHDEEIRSMQEACAIATNLNVVCPTGDCLFKHWMVFRWTVQIGQLVLDVASH